MRKCAMSKTPCPCIVDIRWKLVLPYPASFWTFWSYLHLLCHSSLSLCLHSSCCKFSFPIPQPIAPSPYLLRIPFSLLALPMEGVYSIAIWRKMARMLVQNRECPCWLGCTSFQETICSSELFPYWINIVQWMRPSLSLKDPILEVRSFLTCLWHGGNCSQWGTLYIRKKDFARFSAWILEHLGTLVIGKLKFILKTLKRQP